MSTTLDSTLHQLSSFQYIQQQQQQGHQTHTHHNGSIHHGSITPALIDECCTMIHDINDFCCPTTVEPSTCCGTTNSLTIESLDCCHSPHTQPTINGYTIQEIECCIIESANQEGMDSECCQDLVQPGTVVSRQAASTCCTEHPEVLNDCCQTCCPDAASPSSGSASATSTTPTPIIAQLPHYFSTQSLQCTPVNDSWNNSNGCNHVDNHLQHSSDINNPYSTYHFISNNNNNQNNESYNNQPQQPQQHYHHLNQVSTSNMTPLGGLANTTEATASDDPMSLSSTLMDDDQIDHIIRCLWTGCTAEFMSQDDLLPHVSQLHMPIVGNDHALCLWESCETEQHDGSQLLQHLRADHHIILPLPDVSELESGHSEPKSKTTKLTQQPIEVNTLKINGNNNSNNNNNNNNINSNSNNNNDNSSSNASGNSNNTTTTSTGQENANEGEQHRCGWKGCGRVFSNFDSLTTHLSEDHVGTGKSEYVCEWEGCERNGRGFGQRQKAMRHIQTHTGDKPYQCQLCKKRFSEANIMAQHMRTHTGEKPFKCPEPGCGREFSISGALTIHRRVHTGEKPFKCKFEGCDKWFAESSNLTKHLRVHTGERPFQCPFPGCEKRFSRPDQVTRHKRTHMTAAEKAAEKSAAEAISKAGGNNNKSGKGPASKAQKRAAPSSLPRDGGEDEDDDTDESGQEHGLLGNAAEEDGWSSQASPSPSSLTTDFDTMHAPPRTGSAFQQSNNAHKRLRT
ncbi:hypothetical protein BCR41DRAFT_317947 [Lobosporangium transversale]|uniref:C2H2-type domain-containing protein n=1 Tax=Lobosporangium transversale TaxID=64571 RepID=A0A1Y2GYC5_9FUNG|nr:hypothetical protein BCR41DRAFT_317947 [Lobosporangium transversale]ORZ27276.1 hypothetical protein BCR41DRAFT_317947 [Lobosporangium transversale]|eukprot:XP_021885003.1 hypothetical protein BCR41DRAFT_317947 [Lobosporangium transversale]